MNRTFVELEIRAVDSDRREIEGIASTPSVDRMGDIVEPKGAQFRLPLPFLLDHDHTQAVGTVDRVEVSGAGIRFAAKIARFTEPGKAKELTDYAWSLVREGLRRAVSIGFRPLAWEPIETGMRFTEWEFLELSAVSVPAQADAAITAIKSLTPGIRTAQVPIARPVQPGIKLIIPTRARFYT